MENSSSSPEHHLIKVLWMFRLSFRCHRWFDSSIDVRNISLRNYFVHWTAKLMFDDDQIMQLFLMPCWIAYKQIAIWTKAFVCKPLKSNLKNENLIHLGKILCPAKTQKTTFGLWKFNSKYFHTWSFLTVLFIYAHLM